MSTEHNPDNLTPEHNPDGPKLSGRRYSSIAELREMTEGHFCEKRCPKCNASLLRNKLGEEWCSFIECDFGIEQPRITPDAGKAEAQTLILEETPELQSAEALREYKERTKDVHIGKYGAPAQQPAQEPCLTCEGHGIIGGYEGSGNDMSPVGYPCPDCNPPAQQPAEAMPETGDLNPSVIELVEGWRKRAMDAERRLTAALAEVEQVKLQIEGERTAREQAEKECERLKNNWEEAAEGQNENWRVILSLREQIAESESREHQLREALNNIGHACGISGDRLGVIQALASQALLAPTSTTVADLRKRAETAERERDAVVEALDYASEQKWQISWNPYHSAFIVQRYDQVVGNIGRGRTILDAINAARAAIDAALATTQETK